MNVLICSICLRMLSISDSHLRSCSNSLRISSISESRLRASVRNSSTSILRIPRGGITHLIGTANTTFQRLDRKRETGSRLNRKRAYRSAIARRWPRERERGPTDQLGASRRRRRLLEEEAGVKGTGLTSPEVEEADAKGTGSLTGGGGGRREGDWIPRRRRRRPARGRLENERRTSAVEVAQVGRSQELAS
ncbi:hypothetical protein Taro_014954 [Colocasia esculenta]|uniref:Uncharacterized protein n=1 Tax=Colocasia esculenta TaxID=4460 RepID=A0A843UKX8_COLES|nr:hypothetical protein [Colocasia esculenta]